MKDLERALADITAIRSQLARGTEFRGYGPATVAATGLLALLAAALQAILLPDPAANNSWVNRTAVIDQVGREAAGLPDTCSVVGSGGQTGCAMQQMKQYSAEKRAQQREDDSIP